jgi:hypothetical protein
MEPTKPLFPAALNSGLIISVIGIAIFIIEYVAGIMPVGIFKPFLIMMVSYIIVIGVLVFYFSKYKKDIGGYISFGNAFLYLFIALACSAVITTVFNYIFTTYFDPNYLKHIMELQRDAMESYFAGKLSEEQTAAAMAKFDEQAANTGSIMQSVKMLFGGIIIGAIFALIIGAIMKKKPSLFDSNGTGGVI